MKTASKIILLLIFAFTLTSCESTANSTATDDWDLQINTVDLNGNEVTNEDFTNNILTVVNVWGTWCPPCVAELPHLQEVNEYYKDKGVEIIGIMQDGMTQYLDRDEEVIESGKTLLEEAGATYKVLLPDENTMNNLIMKMQYFPTTFFMDQQGQIIKTVVGSNDTEGWKEIIDEVLEGM